MEIFSLNNSHLITLLFLQLAILAVPSDIVFFVICVQRVYEYRNNMMTIIITSSKTLTSFHKKFLEDRISVNTFASDINN